MSPELDTPKRSSPIVVLLGASNLTLGWHAVTQSVLHVSADPLRLFVALGMGRSYIDRSRFGARELPGILQSGLWDALPESSGLAPRVLITDIGNDLVYGYELDEITSAVGTCVARLRTRYPTCRITMTTLPVDAIRGLGRWRYEFFRRVLFPGLRQELAALKSKALELDARLQQLAVQQKLDVVRPQAEWYGFDPVHIRRRDRVSAFRHMLLQRDTQEVNSGTAHRLMVSRRPPRAAVRSVFGRQVREQQPCQSNARLTVYAY